MKTREFIKFQPLDRKVEQIIRTSSALAKLKGRNSKVEDEMKEIVNQDPNNLENVIAYTFYLWFLFNDRLDLDETDTVFKVSVNVVNVINEVLYDNKELWILQLLKYRIRSFMNFENENGIEELKELLASQREDRYPSYFLAMDILISFSYFQVGDFEQAIVSLEEIFNNYEGKIDYLNEFFYQFIEEYRNIIKRSPVDKISSLLDEIEEEYF